MLQKNLPIPTPQLAPLQADALRDLRALLVGAATAAQELPALADLIGGAVALATGSRHRVILPLANAPAEFTLVRRGRNVLVDCYGTESTPAVFLRERPIRLRALLDACAKSARAAADAHDNDTTGRAMARLAERVVGTPIVTDPHLHMSPVHCTGGSLESPGKVLAFGFSAAVPPAVDQTRAQHAFADVHAMLFEGKLWAFGGARRYTLYTGPIMLVAQRMVAAVRVLVEAWRADRLLNIRLRSGDFSVAVRRELSGDVSMSFSTEDHRTFTLPALDTPSAALPVLRLASDLIRKLITADRSQAHNLRVTSLRREVRELRRTIRTHDRVDSFENEDPDRLRWSSPEPKATAPATSTQTDQHLMLRYSERWRAEVDGLDAASIFHTGDRLVVATPKLTMALAASDGDVLWSQPTSRAVSLLANRVLLRLSPDGLVELCDLEQGQIFARTSITPQDAGVPGGIAAGGGDTPPLAVLTEGRQRLVAIDLRTGEPRWRFRARSAGRMELRLAGRVLLVATGAGSIDAIDTSTGEVVWRFSDRVRFCRRPDVTGNIVIAVSGQRGGAQGHGYGLDLYSGKLLWKVALPAAPSADPLHTQDTLLIPLGKSRNARLAGYDPETGMQRWIDHDPGVDQGRVLPLADQLIVNTPAGRVVSIDPHNGQTLWSRALSNPLTDDVPRRLDPVLRQGVLYVPSARVHALRPSDGAPATRAIDCDLVPDFMTVDERSNLYVAEESGHLRAYATGPHLSLVR